MVTAGYDEDRDPGLQPERTLLSWHRTLILVFLVGLLYLRGALVPGGVAVTEAPVGVRLATLAALLLLCAVLGLHLWYRWRRTGRGLRDPATGEPPPTLASPWALGLLSAGVLGLCVVLAVTALLA
ncbi:DUF202 domain-containing protein [Nocardiopsis sp. EMB25]|uniref:DUF202 domain-containing protein n=1 Tax=Nocardiopsis sp. EMB25 TaxID=2835867 RepID=UPI002284C7BF|nr:DUF202 domain-containing protein [Nocardiopsis sp. EMB25]MCY9786378.1 DUF202 domain-containing protein [Nocardiopsis sp. EMB25]